jgi:hypothetical protein
MDLSAGHGPLNNKLAGHLKQYGFRHSYGCFILAISPSCSTHELYRSPPRFLKTTQHTTGLMVKVVRFSL